MSTQTTINQPAQREHNHLLGAAILAVAVIITGLALATALLGSRVKPLTTETAPTFDAPAFGAEERQPLTFDAPAFRAEERQPLR
jgi:hypothetical protein